MSRAVFAAVLLAAAGVAAAQESKPATQPAQKSEQAFDRASLPFKLVVGDKAPPLTIEKWVKGEPVTGFEKGKVYVVEFWATWCGPCIRAMPHLTELQKEHKDEGLTVIGVTSVDPGNTLEKVEEFLANRGDQVGYTIAWDKGRETNKAYMDAAYQNGIPCSYLIDREGRVAFIGHPMELDKPLQDVLAGTHDIDAAARKYAAKMAPAIDAYRFQQAIESGDIKTATNLYEQAKEKNPRNSLRMGVDLFNALLKNGPAADATKLGSQLIAENNDNPGLLNYVAWSIVDPDADVKHRDLDLALKAAERANELMDSSEPAVLDTLATVYHLKGNHDKAIELQTKAVELAEGEMKEELQARLEQFKAAKERN